MVRVQYYMLVFSVIAITVDDDGNLTAARGLTRERARRKLLAKLAAVG